jgi:hypothetical protein
LSHEIKEQFHARLQGEDAMKESVRFIVKINFSLQEQGVELLRELQVTLPFES